MSANAYRCTECGRVDSAEDVEIMGRRWIGISPIGLVLIVGAERIERDSPFCSPDCVIAAMQKVKRVERST